MASNGDANDVPLTFSSGSIDITAGGGTPSDGDPDDETPNPTPEITWYKDGHSDGTTQSSATRPSADYYQANELTATFGLY